VLSLHDVRKVNACRAMSVRMMQPKIGWTDLDDFCMDINHWSVVKKCNRTLDGAEPRRTTAVGCPGGQCGAT
jgi:hypothetical protein